MPVHHLPGNSQCWVKGILWLGGQPCWVARWPRPRRRWHRSRMRRSWVPTQKCRKRPRAMPSGWWCSRLGKQTLGSTALRLEAGRSPCVWTSQGVLTESIWRRWWDWLIDSLDPSALYIRLLFFKFSVLPLPSLMPTAEPREFKLEGYVYGREFGHSCKLQVVFDVTLIHMSQQLCRIFPILRTLESTWYLRFEVDEISLIWEYVHILLLNILAVPTSLT